MFGPYIYTWWFMQSFSKLSTVHVGNWSGIQNCDGSTVYEDLTYICMRTLLTAVVWGPDVEQLRLILEASGPLGMCIEWCFAHAIAILSML